MKSELLAHIAGLSRELAAPLATARSLSPECYTDDDIFAAESKAVIRSGWISVARSSQIPDPGDWVVVETCGESVLIVRTRTRGVSALSPVCRHKWVQLVEGSGHSPTFVCPYHRWSYDLEGRLRGAPFIDLECISPEQQQLPEFRVEEWQGWVFVNLDNTASPFAEGLAAIDEAVVPWRLPELVPLFPPQRYEGNYNWKTLCDNVGESYHVIGTHAKSIQPYADLPSCRWHTDGTRWCRSDVPSGVRRHVGLAGPTLAAMVPEFIGTWTYNVYPFHVFGLVEDFVVWQRLDVREVGKTFMELSVLVAPELLDAPGIEDFRADIGASVRSIEMEDQTAFNLSYRGQKTPRAMRGSFARYEEGTLHFQRWWAEAMLKHPSTHSSIEGSQLVHARSAN